MQVNSLEKKNIPATFLGSAQQKDVYEGIRNGEYRLVYTTPESFFDKISKDPKQLFVDMSATDRLSVIAIDEAHLIAGWKSFRCSYDCFFDFHAVIVFAFLSDQSMGI
jgi:Werner syndrome ATP-dependent helicase